MPNSAIYLAERQCFSWLSCSSQPFQSPAVAQTLWKNCKWRLETLRNWFGKKSDTEKDHIPSFPRDGRLWNILDGLGYRPWRSAPRETWQIHGRRLLCLCHRQHPWAHSWRCDHDPLNVAMGFLVEVCRGDPESGILF